MPSTDQANSDAKPDIPAPSHFEKPTFIAENTKSRAAFQRSQTFLARTPARGVFRLRLSTIVGLILLFFVVIPLLNSAGIVRDNDLNKLGKYLCYTIVALGVDLIWGYTGILSLCQALFFCLGGYAMAMHLSLPQGGGDVRPEYNNIPQFLFFNSWRTLPFFWKPFESLPLTLILGIAIPGLLATSFGFIVLRSRVRGVYFAIVTQALAFGAWLLICRNELLLGGTNGLTNFSKLLTQRRSYILSLYLATVTAVLLSYLLCLAITRSRLGRVLVAIRDKETRLYFAGYKPYAFKVFAFAVAAMLAAIGGMLYSPQVTLITPQSMDVPASITMVIFVAMGGRGRLWGAVFGAMVVNYAKAAMTSDMASIWPFVEGAMYIAVVLLFSEGFVGLWQRVERQITAGAGLARALVPFVPIATVALFIMLEAMGLMPDILQKVLHVRVHALLGFDLTLKWKYILLVLILGADGLVHAMVSMSDSSAISSTRGFSPKMSPGESSGVAAG